MSRTKFIYISLTVAMSILLSIASHSYAQDAAKDKGSTTAPDIAQPKIKDLRPPKPAKETTKEKELAEDKDRPKPLEVPTDAINVTTEQLANKPQDYLNKNVKFTAPFFAFSNLALDYKPAFRSSHNYLSFLILRPNSHTPFSEIKLALIIPKEKDPVTKMLQTIKEGDTVEIIGHVFACPLDEPWLDVARIKKIASAERKGENAEDKSAEDKESPDGSSFDK